MESFKLIICSLFILFSFVNTQQNSFRFSLNPKEEECLFDYFADKTLVIYEVFTNETNIKVKLMSPEQKQITNETTTFFKYPFTTYSGGYYQICIQNVGDKDTFINFILKYGVAAKDYSSVARTKDLQPIDLELEKLSDRTKYLSHLASFTQSHEQMFEKNLDSITGKIVIFSSLLIGVMIIIGGVETLFLKKFMERRKII